MRKSDDPRIKTLPVVVISGNEEPSQQAARASDLGANDFIAKSADAPEVLARLDNVLRLVKASKELEQTRMAVQSTATHDPLTGTHTPHYLVTEGRKHFAHARRHSGDLSIMALRLDTYEADRARRDQGHRRHRGRAHRQAGDGKSARRGFGGARGAGDLRGARPPAPRRRTWSRSPSACAASSTRRAVTYREPGAQVRHQRRRRFAFLRPGQRDRGPGAALRCSACRPSPGRRRPPPQAAAYRTSSSACCAISRTSTPPGWAMPPSSSPSG